MPELVKVSQPAETVGVTTKTIRFYESFGLLPEQPRTESGYRTHEAADAERLRFIRPAQRLGLPR